MITQGHIEAMKGAVDGPAECGGRSGWGWGCSKSPFPHPHGHGPRLQEGAVGPECWPRSLEVSKTR